MAINKLETGRLKIRAPASPFRLMRMEGRRKEGVDVPPQTHTRHLYHDVKHTRHLNPEWKGRPDQVKGKGRPTWVQQIASLPWCFPDPLHRLAANSPGCAGLQHRSPGREQAKDSLLPIKQNSTRASRDYRGGQGSLFLITGALIIFDSVSSCVIQHLFV